MQSIKFTRLTESVDHDLADPAHGLVALELRRLEHGIGGTLVGLKLTLRPPVHCESWWL